jgi:hypothetical protein
MAHMFASAILHLPRPECLDWIFDGHDPGSLKRQRPLSALPFLAVV